MKKVILTTATTVRNYPVWFIALAVILTLVYISGSMANWINLTDWS